MSRQLRPVSSQTRTGPCRYGVAEGSPTRASMFRFGAGYSCASPTAACFRKSSTSTSACPAKKYTASVGCLVSWPWALVLVYACAL